MRLRRLNVAKTDLLGFNKFVLATFGPPQMLHAAPEAGKWPKRICQALTKPFGHFRPLEAAHGRRWPKVA